MALRSMILVAVAMSSVAFGQQDRGGEPVHQHLDLCVSDHHRTLPRGNTSYLLSQLRGPWQLSENLSLQKNFHPMESLRVQFRADALNAFNRSLWGNIDTNVASSLFEQVTSESDWFSPRKIQFGVVADW